MKYCTACKAKYDDSVSFCSIDGEVLEADPASIVDTVLDGQYQMEALLGKGGMAPSIARATSCSAIAWRSKSFLLKSEPTQSGCDDSVVKVRQRAAFVTRMR